MAELRPKKIDIESININIGGKKIELTIEECGTLYDKLRSLFDRSSTSITIPSNPIYDRAPFISTPGITPYHEPIIYGPTCVVSTDTKIPDGLSFVDGTLKIDVA